jgi:hypothetical protein
MAERTRAKKVSGGFDQSKSAVATDKPELANPPNDAKSALRRSTLQVRVKFRKLLRPTPRGARLARSIIRVIRVIRRFRLSVAAWGTGSQPSGNAALPRESKKSPARRSRGSLSIAQQQQRHFFRHSFYTP